MDEQLLRSKSRISSKNENQEDDLIGDYDKIKDNLINLIRGDDSSFFFFDSFFSLPEGKSLSSVSNLGQILEFILKSYCQDAIIELSNKSLIIINILSQIDIDVEGEPFDFSSFFLSDEFIQRSISHFSNPDKYFAVLALKTLDSFVSTNEAYLEKCFEFGFLDHITEVFIFPDIEDYDSDIESICLDAVKKSIIPISRMNLEQYNPFIFQLSIDFIMADNFLMNSLGLSILRNMIETNFKLDIGDDLFQRFLFFADFGPYYVLDELFALIENHKFPNREEFSQSLGENEFYLKLINRIQTDSSLPSIIFRFFDIAYIPKDDDPVIVKLMEILEIGNIKERIEAIRYLHTLTEKMPTEFCLYLSENGIFQLLSDLIEAKIEVMDDLIEVTAKIINSLAAAQADIMSFSGAVEIFESLQNLSGECDPFYEIVIERTIQQFPGQHD